MQNIMKDKWMNIGYEDDELKPYVELQPDINDTMRIGNAWQCCTIWLWAPASPFFCFNVEFFLCTCLRLVFSCIADPPLNVVHLNTFRNIFVVL